jgi:hypothetical protein
MLSVSMKKEEGRLFNQLDHKHAVLNNTRYSW